MVYSSNSNFKSSTQDQEVSITVTASGHFATNQMKDGIVIWIQGGFWNFQIENSKVSISLINNLDGNKHLLVSKAYVYVSKIIIHGIDFLIQRLNLFNN